MNGVGQRRRHEHAACVLLTGSTSSLSAAQKARYLALSSFAGGGAVLIWGKLSKAGLSPEPSYSWFLPLRRDRRW